MSSNLNDHVHIMVDIGRSRCFWWYYLFFVVCPGAKLDVTALFIKGEVSNIHGAEALHAGWGGPFHSPIIVENCLCIHRHLPATVSTANTYTYKDTCTDTFTDTWSGKKSAVDMPAKSDKLSILIFFTDMSCYKVIITECKDLCSTGIFTQSSILRADLYPYQLQLTCYITQCRGAIWWESSHSGAVHSRSLWAPSEVQDPSIPVGGNRCNEPEMSIIN